MNSDSMLLLRLPNLYVLLRLGTGEPHGEVWGEISSLKWLPDILNRFFAAIIGEVLGDGDKVRLRKIGESVFGDDRGEGEGTRCKGRGE